VDPDSKATGYYDGWTPLSFIAETGQKEIVKLLLTKDVDPDSKAKGDGNKGRTPLSFTAETGQKEVVKLLFKKGVNLDSKDS
jgi:ankyrin repeat protein